MKYSNIFVAGAGKLAQAILNANITIQGCRLTPWNNHDSNTNVQAIIIHAGSGRQLTECIEFCKRTQSILIELSTGMATEQMNPQFPLIICPNTSVLVLKTMNMLKAHGSNFSNYNISITESHQSTKTTEPGTAFAFANALSFPTEKIKSVRKPEIQQNQIGIPSEFLDKHAYHKITIKDGTDEITIETKVLGHNSYAQGIQYILNAVVNANLENKKYNVVDLINSNVL